jgi:hypothetical protein
MKKRVEEQSLRTVALALAGFVTLLAIVPEWARLGVAAFGVVFGVLACTIDADLRASLRLWLDSRRHGNDKAPTSGRAKSPGERRAAT